MPVFDLQGRLLGIPDLLEVSSGLVLESDGGGHRHEDRHNDDNIREESFERSGLVVVRVGAKDQKRRRDTAARIRAGYRDAGRSDRRGWTLQKPGWWWSWPPGRRWD